jgi:hypothetical protein
MRMTAPLPDADGDDFWFRDATELADTPGHQAAVLFPCNAVADHWPLFAVGTSEASS